MSVFHTPDGAPVALDVDRLVIAGWAGRDRAAVEHHIEELAAIGVPAPSSVPLFYRVGAGLLTRAERVQVLGTESSGEVEAVLLAAPDRLWVGLGSDHTDRKVESYSIAVSKQMCPKVVGGELWPFDEVAGHWDQLVLRSHAVIDGERVVYQEGTLAELLSASELIRGYAGGERLPVGCAMFCGTIPAKGGIRPSSRFEMELHDPVRGRSLRHAYDVEALPVVA